VIHNCVGRRKRERLMSGSGKKKKIFSALPCLNSDKSEGFCATLSFQGPQKSDSARKTEECRVGFTEGGKGKKKTVIKSKASAEKIGKEPGESEEGAEVQSSKSFLSCGSIRETVTVRKKKRVRPQDAGGREDGR